LAYTLELTLVNFGWNFDIITNIYFIVIGSWKVTALSRVNSFASKIDPNRYYYGGVTTCWTIFMFLATESIWMGLVA
jgi:hypothetical protein